MIEEITNSIDTVANWIKQILDSFPSLTELSPWAIICFALSLTCILIKKKSK